MKRIAFLLPLLSGVCFGSVGIFIRFFSEAGFNNMAILCTRNAISAVLLFLFMFIYDRNLLKCRIRDLPILLGGGFIGMTLTNIFYLNPAKNTPTSVSGRDEFAPDSFHCPRIQNHNKYELDKPVRECYNVPRG